jgi:hypothetical protein
MAKAADSLALAEILVSAEHLDAQPDAHLVDDLNQACACPKLGDRAWLVRTAALALAILARGEP